jgi:UDP-glucose 4-epimerase
VVTGGAGFLGSLTCGSGIRDYIHVNDLAQAHLLAGEMLVARGGTHAFNLGTGIGTSVLEPIQAVKRLAKINPVGCRGPRRQGDPPKLVASFAKAERELGWKPRQSGSTSSSRPRSGGAIVILPHDAAFDMVEIGY